jgi:hypothetical protein
MLTLALHAIPRALPFDSQILPPEIANERSTMDEIRSSFPPCEQSNPVSGAEAGWL